MTIEAAGSAPFLDGIVLVNKPLGLSSQQVVSRVKRIFGVKKAGHTGSLDPLATGMLPVCLGRATKLCEYLLESDKAYRAAVSLGIRTDSGDREGNIIQTEAVPELTQAQVDAVLASFLGPQQQVPPMFSALKHQGKCLYELARKGIEIERDSRSIQIYSLSGRLTSDTTLIFEVRCSKGTYIRVLGEDIAQKLGTVGHLSSLHRISCAGFLETDMKSLDDLQNFSSPQPTEGKADGRIVPIEKVLTYPVISISSEIFQRLMMGKAVSFEDKALSGRFQLWLEERLVVVADILQGDLKARKVI